MLLLQIGGGELGPVRPVGPIAGLVIIAFVDLLSIFDMPVDVKGRVLLLLLLQVLVL